MDMNEKTEELTITDEELIHAYLKAAAILSPFSTNGINGRFTHT